MSRAIVLRGDAARLPLPDASADLIICSPPYYGLRSYTDGGEHYAGQIGSEATPSAYLEALWRCTGEWVRVLKPSGSLFVNLGDKYNSGPGDVGGNSDALDYHLRKGKSAAQHLNGDRARKLNASVGPKSLLGLPWRYALGCIDRLGLILRAEVIWDKPNGLPESVTDRVCRSHEQVFHFTRQPRYYSAVDEIREAHAPSTFNPTKVGRSAMAGRNASLPRTATGTYEGPNPLGKLPGSVWTIPSAPLTVPPHLGVDHFAAYPPELVRRIILGWSPREVCTACGEGRRPVADTWRERPRPVTGYAYGGPGRKPYQGDRGALSAVITGYACGCPGTTAPATPGIVADPFGGTGTTALVAAVHGRIGITVDRSADYCRLARWRIADPGERARALDVPKPPPVSDGQQALFSLGEVL